MAGFIKDIEDDTIKLLNTLSDSTIAYAEELLNSVQTCTIGKDCSIMEQYKITQRIKKSMCNEDDRYLNELVKYSENTCSNQVVVDNDFIDKIGFEKFDPTKYKEISKNLWLPAAYASDDVVDTNYKIDNETFPLLSIGFRLRTQSGLKEKFVFEINDRVSTNRVASIDLGVTPLFTVYTQSNIIRPSDLLTYKLSLLNQLFSKISKCEIKYKNSNINHSLKTKYKREMMKFQNILEQVIVVRNEILEQVYNSLLDALVELDIKQVIIGDVSIDTDNNTVSVFGKRLTNPRHNLLKDILVSHYSDENRNLIVINESYTTRTSPFTGDVIQYPSTKNIVTGNTVVDSDVNGARNILIAYILGCLK